MYVSCYAIYLYKHHGRHRTFTLILPLHVLEHQDLECLDLNYNSFFFNLIVIKDNFTIISTVAFFSPKEILVSRADT